MKTLISSIFLIAFSSILSIAQTKKINVSEKNSSFINGSHNALSANIYYADENLIEKEWKKIMKDYKAKVSTKKEIFADDALIKKISENTIDIYAKIEKNSDNNYNIIVAFNLGGTYLNSSNHPEKYKIAKELVYDFAVKTTKEAIKNQVKEEEKILSKLEKDKEQLEKNKENLKKDIENYKDKITKAEEDIKKNEKDQTNKVTEIEKQKTVVTSVQEKINSIK